MFKPRGKAFIAFVASETNPQREQGPYFPAKLTRSASKGRISE